MKRKLFKILKDTNWVLKDTNVFKNYEITIDDDFVSKCISVYLSNGKHRFLIVTVATEGEAIAAIEAYATGLRHGKDNSYLMIFDKNDDKKVMGVHTTPTNTQAIVLPQEIEHDGETYKYQVHVGKLDPYNKLYHLSYVSESGKCLFSEKSVVFCTGEYLMRKNLERAGLL
jgi:hypothetical protein